MAVVRGEEGAAWYAAPHAWVRDARWVWKAGNEQARGKSYIRRLLESVAYGEELIFAERRADERDTNWVAS